MDFEEGWRVQYLKDEPFCEVPNDEDEVLCAGSDDERYESPDERRLRYEEAALSYLTGHMPVLLTSVLRGPFEGPDANGWVNPWRSKRDAAQATPAIAEITTLSRTPEVEVRDTDSTTSCHLPSPRSLDQVGITPHPYMEDDELERVHAWRNAAESARKTDDDPTVLLSTEMSQSSAESQSQSQSQKKRRSIGSEWLQRKDNKRRRAEDIAVEDASIVAQPQTQHFLRSQPQSQGTQSQAVAGSGAQSLRSSQSQKLSSQRVSKRSSQTVPTRSSQRLSSKTPAPPASTSEDEVPAPLSTPIQTPQSARRSRVAAKATAKEEHISADEDTDIKLADSEVKVKPEFETQEDESFLFRARPRSRGIEALPDLSHLQEDSFSLSSSSSFASESEDSAQAEDAALDLDGDTFLADDTKETSPESNEEHKGQVVEVLEKVVSREPKSKGLVLQLAADLAADITMGSVDTTEPVKPVAQQDENDIVDRQCQDEEMNEAVVSASQDVTIVEQAAAQGEEDEEPLKNPEPAILPNDTQDAGPPGNPMEQGETHTDSAAQMPIPQSPWSKSDVLPVDRTRPISEAVDEQESSITAETPAAQHTYHMETPNNCHNNIRTTPTPNTTLPFTPTPVADANEATHQPVGVSFAPSGSRSEPSRPESPAVPASQQSPWKTDTQTMAPVPQMQAIHEESNDSFVGPSQQSPWTVSPEKMRQAAQEVLLSKLFNAHVPATPSPLVSSPAQPYAATPGNPIEALETPLAAKTAAPAIETPMAETPRPTTPEPIFSIKRFAQFMSPSPEKPRRLSNKARLSGGHLPSTQNLLAATTTNPWDSSPRPAKRVRWAPLPHEVEDNDNEDDSGPHTPVAARAASPPPEFAVADLPTGDTDQFQKHFQAVSRKRKIRHHLLPSASQQILESPAPMAMAEAFVAADSFASKAPIAPMAPNGSRTAVESSTQDDTDDVDDVLRNLNEFIDMVDLEADLARAKEEEKREKEALEKRKREASGAIPGFSLDSIIDTGVWR
ncbi:protamine p1 [Colletotrichum plurivorum]|uniref:Protamine p1 n=1 Tax=Colletotrichum plurivorum TaxID=2175906 RepID=A0A8H6NAF6_9PEZI|nr:protamine p1 [Colletotrichum plurivorum]